jgi:hypothetical protein
MPRTRHAIRPAAPSLRVLGSDRMQPVVRQRGSVQSVAACAVRSGIVHRWHSVATQCLWFQHILLLRHTCVAAQRQMSRRAAVVAQMSARQWIRSRCRCGRGTDSFAVQRIDSVQLQMWVGGRLSPGADVGRCEPSPVVSDERSPKMQMRAYRGEPYQAARTQHVHETCPPSGRKPKLHPATIEQQV